MTKKSVLILGSLSDIAKSVARKFGENGYNLFLAARNIEELKIQSTDFKIRYDVNINRTFTFYFDTSINGGILTINQLLIYQLINKLIFYINLYMNFHIQ